MSQPCDLLDLLLVDIRDLKEPVVSDMLALAAGMSLPHGGVAILHSAWQVPHQDKLDFWFVSETSTWPFERAIEFTGVEAGRTLFVSTDDDARQQASARGIVSSVPDLELMERLLP